MPGLLRHIIQHVGQLPRPGPLIYAPVHDKRYYRMKPVGRLQARQEIISVLFPWPVILLSSSRCRPHPTFILVTTCDITDLIRIFHRVIKHAPHRLRQVDFRLVLYAHQKICHLPIVHDNCLLQHIARPV